MKLAIIELHTHNQSLNSLLRVLCKSKYDLTVFTSEKIYNDLYDDAFSHFNWEVNRNQSPKKFFLSKKSDMEEYDLILIMTVSLEDKVPYYLLKKGIVIQRIHNVNTWLNRSRNIRLGTEPDRIMKDIFYLCRYVFKQPGIYYFSKMLARMDYATFASEKIVEYCRSKKLLPHEKILGTLPLTLHESDFSKGSNNDEIWFTTPGAIEKRRRDYDILISAISKIADKIENKAVFCFLGNSRKSKYGTKIIKKLNRLEKKHENIKFLYFNQRIPQKQFNDYMLKTDCLLTPMRVNTRFKIYYEKYGTTKIGGIENDIIRFGKPAILPSEYQMDTKLKPVCSFFDSEASLAAILLNIINSKANSSLEMDNKIFKEFSPEKLMKSTIGLLDSVL